MKTYHLDPPRDERLSLLRLDDTLRVLEPAAMAPDELLLRVLAGEESEPLHWHPRNYHLEDASGWQYAYVPPSRQRPRRIVIEVPHTVAGFIDEHTGMVVSGPYQLVFYIDASLAERRCIAEQLLAGVL